MKTNKPVVHPRQTTHEGGTAVRESKLNQLRRTVMACLLWEDSFYENGEEIATRIRTLVHECEAVDVCNLAMEARTGANLRHVPLLMARELCRHKDKKWTAYCISNVVRRADELAELLAIYWKDQPDAPLSGQLKRGLACAFNRFDEYQFAKYNRDGAIKLRDVMFLVHPKPEDEKQAAVFKRIANDELKTPDTWETRLSAGQDKKLAFTELLTEEKLGGLALLRNLRNMTEAGVDINIIHAAILGMKTDRILPYRFISAAKHAPTLEPYLEQAMFRCLEEAEKLMGKTLLLIDVSGSMQAAISAKTDITRIEAGCGLAILLREVCEHYDIRAFSGSVRTVAPRRGFALRDAVMNVFGGSTKLGAALASLNYGAAYDRVIVITDEQSEDTVFAPKTKGYILNVASYQNGVGYGDWTKITGWSEQCVRYIVALEAMLGYGSGR